MTWDRFLALEPEWHVISLAILAIMIAVVWYVVSKIRAKPIQREPQASELLSKFREMHSQGGLTDAEFRTIKTTLVAQLEKELKDNSETA